MRRLPRQSSNRSTRTPRVEPLERRQLLAAELVSVNLAGTGPGNGLSTESSVSGTGRYVAFVSTSNDLVAGDTNGKADVFLRDRHNNTTVLVSKNPTTGEAGNAESFEPKVNNDGTFVVFATRASNLIPGDLPTNGGGSTDVVRYNISNGALELVNQRLNGGFPGGGSGEPSVSADGRFVAFTTFAGNIGANDDNDANDVFVRDMTKTGIGAIVMVSQRLTSDFTQQPGDQQSFDPQVSDDGNFVSFRSDATNLVANDTNGLRDTFVRNISAGTTTLVSVSTSGTSGNAESQSNSISGDGNFVAFRSLASDLVPNDTNNAEDIFLRNLDTNTTTLLTSNKPGTASARGVSEFPWLSSDAGAAVFSSTANDLIGNDNNSQSDVFLRDLINGPIYMISTNSAGNAGGNGASFDPYTSRNGKFISFSSEASDLSSVTDSNAQADVYFQVAPNNPGDPDDPDVDPATGPGPDPGTVPGPGPTPPPDPNPEGPDTTPPVVTLPSTQPAPSQGSTTYDFNVNMADERALNTLVIGNVQVTKAGGSPQTATFVNVVGSGKSAVATFRLTFANPLSSTDNGAYTVDLPADTIKDAAGNAAPAATLGAFTLTVGSPNDPDLTAETTAKFKAGTLILGPKARGTARVKVTNIGPTAILKQNVPVTLYLSDNQSRDAADIQLATSTRPLSLKTGKSKTVSLRFTYPAATGTGSYFLIGEVDTGNALTESNESNNVSIATGSQTLAAPVIDLRATVSRPSGSLTPNGKASSTVTVINDGNVRLSRTLTIRLAASPDAGADPSDTVITTITKRVSVNPGKPRAVPINFTLPPALAAGTYFVTATLDPLGEIVETSKSNNTAVTVDTVNVG